MSKNEHPGGDIPLWKVVACLCLPLVAWWFFGIETGIAVVSVAVGGAILFVLALVLDPRTEVSIPKL